MVIEFSAQQVNHLSTYIVFFQEISYCNLTKINVFQQVKHNEFKAILSAIHIRKLNITQSI